MVNLTKDNKLIGDIGEEVASNYLKGRGFKTLDRNYLKKWGEIDLVVSKNNRIHFVEVKTISRSEDRFDEKDGYRPEDNVHSWKIKRIYRTIESYLMENGVGDREWQMDLISVYLDLNTNKAKVNYLENIA